MPTVGQRLLREAVERMGGPEQLSAKLQLSVMSIEALRKGERPISDVILLKLIDIIDALPKQS